MRKGLLRFKKYKTRLVKEKNFLSARNYAFKLIALRQYSEKELRDKLKIKNYSKEVTNELIAYFKSIGIVNDKEFSRHWIDSRLKKPLSIKVIKSELRKKGIDQEMIDETFSSSYANTDEDVIAREFAKEHLARLINKAEPKDKIRTKLYAYLMRRGFEDDKASEIVKELLTTV